MSEISKYKWGESIGEVDGVPIYGGNCFGGMPAVFMTGIEETGERYARTEEEWELFGAHLPPEITVLVDVEIGCVEYQQLLVAGLAIEDCSSCQIRQNS